MKLPLILTEYGTVQVFESVADLLLHIESPDIEDVTVFDSAGDLIPLSIQSGEPNQSSQPVRWYSRWFKSVPVLPVHIAESGVRINRAMELEDILKQFLGEHKMAEQLAGSESLDELIGLVQKIYKRHEI